MIQGATPGRAPIFVCCKSWLCCRLANIFNLQNESFLYLLLPGNITFKNIINFVSFIINLVEFLVINSYCVTVLDNFRKETSDRARKHLFWRYSTSLLSFWGPPTHLHGPPSWTKVWWRYHFDSLNYHFIFTTSLQVRELCSCFTAACHSLLLKKLISNKLTCYWYKWAEYAVDY